MKLKKNQKLWKGALIGFLAYALYELLFSIFTEIIKGNFSLGHVFVIFGVFIFMLPLYFVVGGIIGLIVTSILLKRIKNPVYIGISIAFLIYLFKGYYVNFSKFGFLAEIFYGKPLANLWGNTYLYQGIGQLIIFIGVGAFIGYVWGKIKKK